MFVRTAVCLLALTFVMAVPLERASAMNFNQRKVQVRKKAPIKRAGAHPVVFWGHGMNALILGTRANMQLASEVMTACARTWAPVAQHSFSLATSIVKAFAARTGASRGAGALEIHAEGYEMPPSWLKLTEKTRKRLPAE